MSSGSRKVGFSVFWVWEGRFQYLLGLKRLVSLSSGSGKVGFSVFFWVWKGRFQCLLGLGR